MSLPAKRILIIDDAATIRLYHRNILEESGFTIEEAVNGIEALEKALSMPFDLYLVDINMPKQDGYVFLKALRSQPIFQAPAIMISTEAEYQDQQLAFEAGANFYLIKPCKPQELLYICQLLLGIEEGA